MNLIQKISQKINSISSLIKKIDDIQLAIGRLESRQLGHLDSKEPNFWEFKVNSQWGEDGIIQFLLKNVKIENKIFVEFGVENYTEANTLFLLQNDYWKGLVIDGSTENINQIKKRDIYWRYNLKAVSSFITKDNITRLFHENGISGDIGLLSVDIDGNDYWVWSAIENVNPSIIIAEYNSLFGPNAKISTPYQEDFVRGGKNPIYYYGASISALTYLANQKGYELVAGNKAGNNVFFVKKELLGNLKVITPNEAYVQAQFKESRDLQGNLTFTSFEEAQLTMHSMDVIEVEKNQKISFGQAIGRIH